MSPNNENDKAGAVEEKPKATSDPSTEKLRINRAFQLSVTGLVLAALLVVALLAWGVKDPTGITSVVGLFTSVLGTLVGAFFGVQVGSAGKEEAEERANETQKQVNALASAADKKTLDAAQKIYPNLFKK